jgi:ATP-dependent Clp protease protease subunit
MKFWNLVPDEAAPEDGVLDIDGEIIAEEGWFTPDGACVAKEFRKALKGMKNVTVHINSPGGDVMAGAEIYSALREHSMNGEGKVHVIVTALAASAASIIAMAGDRISMHPVAYMMIHNPWTIAMGDAKELRKTAKTLDVISEGLVTAYEQRTGKDREELKKMLEAETWMSAVTCVEEGFADEILTAAGAAAKAIPPTKMSAKAHGACEIAARIREPEAEPEETPADPAAIAAREIADRKRAEIRRRAEIAQRAEIAAGITY